MMAPETSQMITSALLTLQSLMLLVAVWRLTRF